MAGKASIGPPAPRMPLPPIPFLLLTHTVRVMACTHQVSHVAHLSSVYKPGNQLKPGDAHPTRVIELLENGSREEPCSDLGGRHRVPGERI